ncbi:urease accessory protein UreF [Chitinophaga qingshengii]|uniref:Urease accessory protein UreF n=1 Tax=Chitinophaga qingshengii TaxID=1569794 RepID=A0ABR7TPB6_9BACT|nr:urease accessory protein UreF [Chitinophaga qingshengii]MBC9932318.1 urease accessory protein UreF [Chitinophaga qingshengii]
MQQKNDNTFHFLGSLLHLSDPTLPIGGYTHSNGLETYVQLGLVNNVASAEQFVQHMLSNNLQYNDAAFVCLAYRAAAVCDLNALLALDEEASALKMPREIRQASQKLGVRLMKIFSRQQTFSLAQQYEAATVAKKAEGHYSIAFGLYASLMGIPLPEALYAFFYNAAVGMVTNAVKLVPLGQLDGQDILFRMQTVISPLVKSTMELDRDLVGVCNIGFDIRCMQHEQLYSRLYMS